MLTGFKTVYGLSSGMFFESVLHVGEWAQPLVPCFLHWSKILITTPLIGCDCREAGFFCDRVHGKRTTSPIGRFITRWSPLSYRAGQYPIRA